LVLKSFWLTDYRGAVARLRDNPYLLQLLALPKIPHFTTLQKASRQLLASAAAKRLLKATIREQFGWREESALTAALSEATSSCRCKKVLRFRGSQLPAFAARRSWFSLGWYRGLSRSSLRRSIRRCG